ncbi:MAG: class I SAM-dependent methyltransferase [Polyangiaceae bacterium]|nr:class I SAM-dependent methyltransferase [Polyangiaceae bacterium]
MTLTEWNVATCRRYADGMRRLVKVDHAPWAARIVELLGKPPASAAVAEIAAGPAFLLIEIGRRLPATLLALDAEPTMLDIATEEGRRAGIELRTVASRAERLQLPDASVDVAVCKQLLNCVADVGVRKQIVQEMVRVLRPGGRAFVIDFDASAPRAAAWLIRAWVRAAAGAEFARDFWAAQGRRFDPDSVVGWMRELGLEHVRRERRGLSFLVEGTRLCST